MTDQINKAERTYGASFRRDLDCWVVYAGLGEEELCRCSHDKVDGILAALRLPPVRFTREDVEKAARTIDPFGWGQLDTALRPYKENRGARGILGEQFWYGITWGRNGFRTEDEVRHWFLIERTKGKEGDWPSCVFGVRSSLKKAAAILAAIGEVEHG